MYAMKIFYVRCFNFSLIVYLSFKYAYLLLCQYSRFAFRLYFHRSLSISLCPLLFSLCINSFLIPFFFLLFLETTPFDGGSTSARRSIHRGRIMQQGEKRTIANCLGISRKLRNQDVSLLFPSLLSGGRERKRERQKKKITSHLTREPRYFVTVSSDVAARSSTIAIINLFL